MSFVVNKIFTGKNASEAIVLYSRSTSTSYQRRGHPHRKARPKISLLIYLADKSIHLCFADKYTCILKTNTTVRFDQKDGLIRVPFGKCKIFGSIG